MTQEEIEREFKDRGAETLRLTQRIIQLENELVQASELCGDLATRLADAQSKLSDIEPNITGLKLRIENLEKARARQIEINTELLAKKDNELPQNLSTLVKWIAGMLNWYNKVKGKKPRL